MATTKAQPQNLNTEDFISQSDGSFWLDGGLVFSDGAGNVVVQTIRKNGLTGTVQTLSTGNTITVGAGVTSVRVTAGAAVTGIILPAGTVPFQELKVIHEGAAGNTITFAASGTSNVADGASAVITGPSYKDFVWDSVTSLWYHN